MSNIVKMPSISPQNWPQQNWSGSWPPSCSCGCNPCQCGGGWGGMSGLMQCWQDISQFQQFLACMLSTMGPVPLQGVTDGSNALAGNIGEFVTMQASFSIPTAAQVGAIVTVGVLSPGDWTCNAYCNTTVVVSDLSFHLSPIPAGFSNAMDAALGNAAGLLNATFISPMARGSISVPTLVAFAANTNTISAGTTAGSGTIYFSARRSR